MNSGCKPNSQRHMELLRHIVCHKPPFCPLLGAGMKSLPAGGLRAFPSGQRSYPKGALRTAESKATIEDAEQNPCPPEASGRSFAGREAIPKEHCERQGVSRRLRMRSKIPARRRPPDVPSRARKRPKKRNALKGAARSAYRRGCCGGVKNPQQPGKNRKNADAMVTSVECRTSSRYPCCRYR